MKLFLVFFFSLTWFKDCYAYLDPGVGSLVLQSAIAAFTAGLYIIKSYWTNLKAFFSKKSNPDVTIKNESAE